ncbi:hypothetical protein F5148DRAFT_1256105 [Russula earlei]|uniref:Uncharacterized protein n=1 Tax=Russula earlei TaxID=71964 RepID=A0ACC0TV16_9AGAM|nr:hypothetical protein F5148DRAFT_1256105 [Russula earlei]
MAVLTTVFSLSRHHYVRTLLRPHEVIQAPRLATVGTVAEKLKRQERNREDKRQRQIAASRARRDATEKRKREDQDVVDPDPDGHELELKKMKTTAQCDDEAYAPDVTMVTVAADDTTLAMPLPESAPEIQVLSRHSKEVRGHTSFLTFACLLPAVRS